jgi:hypothetical protein
MEELSSWIAPIATAIAACMTASNLGTRVTGWGFVVFTIGSVAWTTYGAATDQPNLVWQNLFLTAVNLVGVWRWLGRQARLDDGAKAASEKSEARPGPTLIAASSLASAPIVNRKGQSIGTAIDAMIGCEDGRIAYLVAGKGGVGGIGETLYALPWEELTLAPDKVIADIGSRTLRNLHPVDPSDWPAAR